MSVYEAAGTWPVPVAERRRRRGDDLLCPTRLSARWPLLMPLLFMVILPQIDLRNKMSSQAANRLQGGFVVGEEEAARRLSDGYDAPSPELNIDPLGRNPEAGCQLGHGQMACDRGPSCLSMLHFEAVFEANALDRNRQDFIRLPWRVMPFLRQNARDLVVVDAATRQRTYALYHLLMPRQRGYGIDGQRDRQLGS